MKKLFLAIILTCLACNSLASNNINASDVAKAEKNGNFQITSDVRQFNPLTGVYNLKGHVYVNFPTHGENLIIKGDTAQFKLYSQEVYAQNNINLQFGDLYFKCDKVNTQIKERTAYVDGNIQFKHKKNKISADSAAYNWKTKLATFKNASLNGSQCQPLLIYNVLSGKIAD